MAAPTTPISQLTIELRKAMDAKKVLIGKKSVLDAVERKKATHVYYAKNTPESIKGPLSIRAGMTGVECTALELTNREFGTLLKRPYSVTIIALIKA